MRLKIILVLVPLILIGVLLSKRVFSGEDVNSLELVKGLATPTESRKRYADTCVAAYAANPSWYPKDTFGTATQPEIVGTAGILVDINSGKVLFEKNSSERAPIASLVKIMTAVVALEHAPLDERITISDYAAGVGENSMQTSEGERYSLEELLYGLMLHSGNDAAYAIAAGVAGDTNTFVEWMNFRAKELGLKDTYFADPCGLDDSTYSSPVDLVKLARYAMQNPEFVRVVGTVEKELYGDTHKYIYLYNQTNLLTTYPGVTGIKTGFTEEAGLCLVTYAKNEGIELVGVVLNSVDRKGDMILMLDHGFSVLGVAVEHNLL